MKKSILITGIAGTGKSSIIIFLQQQGYTGYGIEDIKGLCRKINRETSETITNHNCNNFEDFKKYDWICDIMAVQDLMQKNSDGLIFYSGTAANIDELIPLFDKIFLLQADKNVLSRRLTERVNNPFGKSKEIQNWIFDQQVEWDKALIQKGAIPIDATQDIKTVASSIIEMSKTEKSSKSGLLAVDDHIQVMIEKNDNSIRAIDSVSQYADCYNLSSVLVTNDLPKELMAKLRLLLGEDLHFRRIDAHRNRTSKWICSGSNCSKRLVIKHLGLKESREALIYERVLRPGDLPAPRFWGAVEDVDGTWLIIDYIDGVIPVSENDFSDLANALSALHNNQQALELLSNELQVPKAPLRYTAIVERSLQSLSALCKSQIVHSSIRLKSRRLIQLADWRQEAAWLAMGPMVPVHGNVHIGNVLVQWMKCLESSKVMLIDWPDMMIGSPLEDLGTLVADVPARMDLIRIAYGEASGNPIDARDLLRAFHFQLFVEVAWRAGLVLENPESKEIGEFYRRASLFGI